MGHHIRQRSRNRSGRLATSVLSAEVDDALRRLREDATSKRVVQETDQGGSLFRSTNHVHQLRWTLQATAKPLLHDGRWADAYELLEEIVHLCREHVGERDVVGALSDLADCAHRQAMELKESENDKAIGWYAEAGHAYQELGNSEFLAITLVVRGQMVHAAGLRNGHPG